MGALAKSACPSRSEQMFFCPDAEERTCMRAVRCACVRACVMVEQRRHPNSQLSAQLAPIISAILSHVDALEEHVKSIRLLHANPAGWHLQCCAAPPPTT